MISGVYNFNITQGDTWSNYLDFFQDDGVTPLDLTNYHAKLYLKSNITASSVIASLFDGSGLTISSNRITINVSNTITSSWNFGTAIYDLKLTSPNGIVTTYLSGSVDLQLSVSV